MISKKTDDADSRQATRIMYKIAVVSTEILIRATQQVTHLAQKLMALLYKIQVNEIHTQTAGQLMITALPGNRPAA